MHYSIATLRLKLQLHFLQILMYLFYCMKVFILKYYSPIAK